MKVEDLLRMKNAMFEECNKLTVLKGRGYGSKDDTLLNLKFSEFVGVVDSEISSWVRLSDKIVRLGRILKAGEGYVGFEGLIDTILDAVNYLLMIAALLYEKDEDFRRKFDERYKGWQEREFVEVINGGDG